ncbi:MAG: hypothetical protein KGH79_01720 [Patescibacteria group bacterium]|nr:hypothetical protein [Patescibacteria group bacterium]
MNAIAVSQLQKTYSTGVEALKGISLTVGEGDSYTESVPLHGTLFL